MAYFNYHAKAQNLIKKNYCIKAEITKKWNQISPALVLHFINYKPMPIRIEKWLFYFDLLKKYNVKIIDLTRKQ